MPRSPEDLIVDRGLLLDLALDSRRQAPSRSIELLPVAARYARILYEPTGISAIERVVHKLNGLQNKLVAIPRGIEASPDCAERFNMTVAASSNYPSILHAHQRLQRQKGGPARSVGEDVAYIFHLLILARHFSADVAFWPARSELISALFHEAGADSCFAGSSEDELKIFRSETCTFPFLPAHNKSIFADRFGSNLIGDVQASRRSTRSAEALAPQIHIRGNASVVIASGDSPTIVQQPINDSGAIEKILRLVEAYRAELMLGGDADKQLKAVLQELLEELHKKQPRRPIVVAGLRTIRDFVVGGLASLAATGVTVDWHQLANQLADLLK